MPELTSTTLGRFCRELAGGLDDIPILIEEWGITPEYFEVLQKSPAFVAEMQIVRSEMAELGNDAGYVYRMKSLSEEMLPEFVKMLRDPTTTTGQKFDMIKWAAEMARLKEKPTAKADLQAGPRGPTVVFRFGAGLPVHSMTLIPAEEPQQIMGGTHEIMGSAQADESGWPV